MIELLLKLKRGGFLRLFGCGWFIREFLLGNGPNGSPMIVINIGAPQVDIFYHYKRTLMRATALDWAVRTEEKRAPRKKRPINPDIIDMFTERYLVGLSYKTTSCRYHSFIVYFSNIVSLGCMEPLGKLVPLAFQSNYPPGQPRKYFRLTLDGKVISDSAWANPLFALYR